MSFDQKEAPIHMKRRDKQKKLHRELKSLFYRLKKREQEEDRGPVSTSKERKRGRSINE
ncbi:hypothetical protein [Salipaludibacillus daqingensis]|uniref:hypothetical protein n=1 Tax=Salipaludibacillus daqingensis TaxID=3041001 RepID=UPI0024771187|nr:hypothetical protein [Salipaludibacillus daqingensis]